MRFSPRRRAYFCRWCFFRIRCLRPSLWACLGHFLTTKVAPPGTKSRPLKNVPKKWLTSGASWASLGVILGHLGPAQSYLELSWSHLGLRRGQVGLSWAILGPAWGQPGASLGPAWARLGRPGASLGSSGATWGQLGLVWPFLEPFCSHFGDIWKAF